EVYARSVFWTALAEALEDLPEEQRQVFVMHELEGKTFKEIAETTGENLNTLLSRKRYAVLFLREQLTEIYDDIQNL
ncbi:MAG TPA: sigma factor-like helix-turn-helix DNA-binding protein, partial [Bacteroidota bacterium]|nr:sigma factor-like helix-turn-helix DNA-binding protein [Bacteroidota bacterium]